MQIKLNQLKSWWTRKIADIIAKVFIDSQKQRDFVIVKNIEKLKEKQIRNDDTNNYMKNNDKNNYMKTREGEISKH
jgi:hypothetical protein